MNIQLPELSLIVLIGPSGSGKSSFGKKHFKPTEVISSDYCRGLISDDENNQAVTQEAFDLLHTITAKRLALGKLTVIDATNVQAEARKPLLQLAKQYHALPIAIVFKMSARLCLDRNATRLDRQFGPHVIRRQLDDMRRSLPRLKREGFNAIYEFSSEAEVNAATIMRTPMWTDRKTEHGPFDIIGDVHGCYDEIVALLNKLGYPASALFRHPHGRKAIFLGDLVDRGNKTPEVLELVMDMVERGDALCVPGNHDIKLLRKLNGRDVQITHGLAESLAQLATRPPEFIERVKTFLASLISHFVLDDGKLVAAHAGVKEAMQGRGSGAVREFALYGETTGETDEFGLPIRYNWAAEYKGRAMVVYGHTPVPEPEWLNGTINIDTGCVFGGALTALRYPERELVSVPALRVYAEPVRPLLVKTDDAAMTAQQQHDDVLEIDGVLGKKYIQTRLMKNIIIAHENAVTALEVMSRFTINPKWLIYLPPTMAPTESHRGDLPLLEHPSEAFAHFAREGVAQAVCEEKHMGSRAIVVVGRDEDVVRKRFGIFGEGAGVAYTRTGRRFFDDAAIEGAFLARIREAITQVGWWDVFKSDWFCLDCELMPWSAKAQGLLKEQYAAVGSAAQMAMREVLTTLQQATTATVDASAVLAAYQWRSSAVDAFVEAYRRYCWPVQTLDDYKLAPFHLLASEGAVHVDKTHAWHMRTLAELCDADPGILRKTQIQTVELSDADSVRAGVEWWMQLTGSGGEGMVVKPLDFVTKGNKGLVQPGIKVRGCEYLRIIYGPEYDAPEHLQRLRVRSVHAKRRLALRELALGVESLERFVRREPLARVHECVFGVLALESEPVDPRL